MMLSRSSWPIGRSFTITTRQKRRLDVRVLCRRSGGAGGLCFRRVCRDLRLFVVRIVAVVGDPALELLDALADGTAEHREPLGPEEQQQNYHYDYAVSEGIV